MLNVQPHHVGLGGQGLGDKNLHTLVLELSIGAVVLLTGVGIDRHRGMATSAEGGDIVERDRVLSLFQVLFRRGANCDVQGGQASGCCRVLIWSVCRLESNYVLMHGGDTRARRDPVSGYEAS